MVVSLPSMVMSGISVPATPTIRSTSPLLIFMIRLKLKKPLSTQRRTMAKSLPNSLLKKAKKAKETKKKKTAVPLLPLSPSASTNNHLSDKNSWSRDWSSFFHFFSSRKFEKSVNFFWR